MELYVIRHGKTDWNKEYRFQGAHDIPLNEEGRQAARKLGEHLKDVHFDYVFSSPLSRAYETACIVIETPGSLRHSKGSIKTDPLLTEVSFGEFEGLPFDQWMDTDEPRKYFFKEPARYVPPKGGETFESGIERTGKFVHTVLEPIYKEKPDARIMIVAHGAILAALMCNLENRGVENYWGNGLKGNCEETIYNYDGKVWTLASQEKPQENPYVKMAEEGRRGARLIKKSDPDSAKITADILKEGGVVIIPTDTVYGFSGKVESAGALREPQGPHNPKGTHDCTGVPEALEGQPTEARIRTIKGRSETKPMIQLIASPLELAKYTKDVLPGVLLQKWPGALTIIVNDNRGGTTAFRCPGDEWLRKVIADCGSPIYSTSVNRSGQPVLDDQSAIIKEFALEVDLIVTDGDKKGAKPSTIVSITDGTIKVLRQGDVQIF
ncbi:MAG: histidine phosphatase family protein [Treponema sp.]|nr:histidine phosphatase family protein [Treponema sp.]